MDEEGFFAVGVFDVGFRHAGLEVEDGVAGGWISWRGKRGEEGRGRGGAYASSLKALRIPVRRELVEC